MAKCFLCHRKLTNQAHAVRGYSDDCAKKYQRYLAECGSSLEEIALLTLHSNATVRRWVEIAGKAMRIGNKRHAAHFLNSARRTAHEALEDASVMTCV